MEMEINRATCLKRKYRKELISRESVECLVSIVEKVQELLT